LSDLSTNQNWIARLSATHGNLGLDRDVPALNEADGTKSPAEAIEGAMLTAEAVLRNAMIGIVTCCAPAASGDAAAPPSSVMYSRRFTRSPRRRAPALMAG
jgi:hypothetical protein